jgi:predicted ATP-dependent endonuclease of OLD family
MLTGIRMKACYVLIGADQMGKSSILLPAGKKGVPG